MELQEKTVTLRKLTASEGMYLTQVSEVSERVFSDCVYLGQGESVENWREATEEEKLEYEEKQKFDVRDIQ